MPAIIIYYVIFLIIIIIFLIMTISYYAFWFNKIEINESINNGVNIVRIRTGNSKKYNMVVANYISQGYEVVSEQPKNFRNHIIYAVMKKTQ